jgi:hypothetical protein
LMKLQFEEFDNIRSLHRETIKKYVVLSKVWNKSLKVLFFTDPNYLNRYIKVSRAIKEGKTLRSLLV